MRTVLLTLLFLFFSQPIFAQCVGEIKAITQDVDRGSIKVQTEYSLNGAVIDVGTTRYDESSASTILELRDVVRNDIQEHCKTLIIKIAVNRQFLVDETLVYQKSLTQPLIDNLQQYVGHQESLSTTTVIYKGKEVTLNADGTHSITDVTP